MEVVDRDALRAESADAPVVVVTAMALSSRARADLSELLGSGYLIVDIKQAPSTANVVLAPAVSAFALASLRRDFPQARVLFAELADYGRGIEFIGPLSRALASGPDGYFVARDLESLAPVVAGQARLQLAGDTRPTPIGLGAPDRAVVAPAVGASGTWVDLDAVDDLVRRVQATDHPRASPLWLAVVAECAIHLARHTAGRVSVDVGGLDPLAVAELRERIGREDVSLS